jgi:O-antigen ligase
VADGLALHVCAVAAAIGCYVWRDRRVVRVACALVLLSCAAGIIFTLTRAIWLGTALAAVATLLVVKELRRFLIPAVGLALVAVLAVVVLVPGFATTASDRTSDQHPVWDRLNTNAAAVRVVEHRPLGGVGWQRFVDVNPDYVRQADTYPITGTDIEVHNVFLGRAAELGLPGLFLYLAALVLACLAAFVPRVPPELRPWRIGAFAILIQWLFVANLGPLPYAFANAMLWLWLGVVAAPFLSISPTPSRRPRMIKEVTHARKTEVLAS